METIREAREALIDARAALGDFWVAFNKVEKLLDASLKTSEAGEGVSMTNFQMMAECKRIGAYFHVHHGCWYSYSDVYFQPQQEGFVRVYIAPDAIPVRAPDAKSLLASAEKVEQS